MRTQDEIVARYEATKADDFFGFTAEVLVGHLDFEHAKPYLKPEATADSWEQGSLDAASLLAELRDYLDFAWGKAIDHRGISASRSIDKLTQMAWLCGHDDAVRAIEDAEYAPYGAPKLAALSAALEIDIPDDDDARRMAKGEPCTPECSSCFS